MTGSQQCPHLKRSCKKMSSASIIAIISSSFQFCSDPLIYRDGSDRIIEMQTVNLAEGLLRGRSTIFDRVEIRNVMDYTHDGKALYLQEDNCPVSFAHLALSVKT